MPGIHTQSLSPEASLPQLIRTPSTSFTAQEVRRNIGRSAGRCNRIHHGLNSTGNGREMLLYTMNADVSTGNVPDEPTIPTLFHPIQCLPPLLRVFLRPKS